MTTSGLPRRSNRSLSHLSNVQPINTCAFGHVTQTPEDFKKKTCPPSMDATNRNGATLAVIFVCEIQQQIIRDITVHQLHLLNNFNDVTFVQIALVALR